MNRWEDDKLLYDIELGAMEYNRLMTPGMTRAFDEAKDIARSRILTLMEQTENLRRIEPERIADVPEALSVLRMLCRPPMTRDRLSGVTGVPIKRIYSLESGGLPLRPSGRKKLLEGELPAIVRAVRENLDHSLAAWVREARDPTQAERERLCDMVADRSAIMSDVRSGSLREMGARVEEDVEGWLRARGYFAAEMACSTSGSLVPEGGYAVCGGALKVPDARRLPSFAVASRRGELVFVDVNVSANSNNALHARMAADPAADHLAAAHGGRYAFVLCGMFDAAYVRYQLGRGRHVVWHHDLDGLADLGL